jgi:hypothetical protein
MRRWLLWVIGACSFTRGVPSVSLDAALPDAPPPDAAPPCNMIATGAPMSAGVLGGSGGGGADPDLVCAVGELPVGLAFDYSTNTDKGGQHVVRAVHVRCGKLRRTSTGAVTTTVAEVKDSPVAFFCPFWADNSVPEQFCPSGMVLVSVVGNAAGDSEYNSVTLSCRALSADGRLTGAITTLSFVPSTGSYTTQPQTATCPQDQVIATFGLRTGCANDALIPKCTPIVCQ